VSAVVVAPPSGPVDAVVRVPGSKSVANRALVCAALAPAGAISRIENVPGGDDCAAMVSALSLCGAWSDGTVTGGAFPGDASVFDAGIAGTTSRFLTAAACLSVTGVTVDGGEPLRRRPMADLHDALRHLGAEVSPVGGAPAGHLPVRVARGSLHGGTVPVRGDVSSQFVTALMLLAPRLDGGLRIKVEGDLVSRPYVEMTARVMSAFGASVEVQGQSIDVRPVVYGPAHYVVEPDFSSAAFPVMSLAFRPGRVVLPGLATATLQGDSLVLDIARAMGMEVTTDGHDITVMRAEGSVLRAVSFDLSDASDLVPAVAVACTNIAGTSRITGVGFIRGKESDRLGDLAAELAKARCAVTVEEDGLSIAGSVGGPPCDEPLATHHDHRLAMSFALLALGRERCTVEDPGVVSKSWPGYFSDMSGVLGSVMGLN
jgi:3-phosphoshikimate 1-carboxyvinyltransferase